MNSKPHRKVTNKDSHFYTNTENFFKLFPKTENSIESSPFQNIPPKARSIKNLLQNVLPPSKRTFYESEASYTENNTPNCF